MYTEGKRRDIQLLLAAGVPQERIAKLTGASVRTIRRIGRDGRALPRRRGGMAAESQRTGQPAVRWRFRVTRAAHCAISRFYGQEEGWVNYVRSAIVAGFVKIKDAMLAYGAV